jgi:hypothetical protein
MGCLLIVILALFGGIGYLTPVAPQRGDLTTDAVESVPSPTDP